MATNLMQPPITTSYYYYYYSVPPQSSKIQHPLISLKRSTPKLYSTTRFQHLPSSQQFSLTLACTSEEHNSTVLVDENDTLALTKASVYKALEGMNRGVFGVTSSKKKEIEDLVIQLEANNPTPNPTTNLDKISGWWKLVYSTITILGSKRTKLGLRDFINLGDFLQMIDVAEGKAVNIVKFSSRGLNLLNGQLTIQASFSVASPSRVDIKYDNSQITPEQLMNLFKKNYELLLSIYNPEGWLEITYVDDTMRIGRDDKGNIFILERCTDTDQL